MHNESVRSALERIAATADANAARQSDTGGAAGTPQIDLRGATVENLTLIDRVDQLHIGKKLSNSN